MTLAEKKRYVIPPSIAGILAGVLVISGVVLVFPLLFPDIEGAVEWRIAKALATGFVVLFGVWFLFRFLGIVQSKKRYEGQRADADI